MSPVTSLVAQTVKRLPTMRESRVQSLGWEDLPEKEMATHSSILPGRSHGQRSLVGYSPWGRKESDTTEQLHFHLTRWHNGKESACRCRSLGFNPCFGKIPWRRKWLATPVLLPGEFHQQWSLAGYSPWGHKELDMTEQITLSLIGNLSQVASIRRDF